MEGGRAVSRRDEKRGAREGGTLEEEWVGEGGGRRAERELRSRR